MMQALLNLLTPVALVASLYTCGGAVVRLRYGRHLMSPAWVWMYFAIFAMAALGAATQITPLPPAPNWVVEVVYVLHMTTSIAVGVYIRLTAPSWREGIPPVASSGFGGLH